jgi:hypothetical protein
MPILAPHGEVVSETLARRPRHPPPRGPVLAGAVHPPPPGEEPGPPATRAAGPVLSAPDPRPLLPGPRADLACPLFPGYLFLLGTREEGLATLATGRVVRSLEVANQQELWRDLRRIHRLQNAPGSPSQEWCLLLEGLACAGSWEAEPAGRLGRAGRGAGLFSTKPGLTRAEKAAGATGHLPGFTLGFQSEPRVLVLTRA